MNTDEEIRQAMMNFESSGPQNCINHVVRPGVWGRGITAPLQINSPPQECSNDGIEEPGILNWKNAARLPGTARAAFRHINQQER
jgi:hypothetical protein